MTITKLKAAAAGAIIAAAGLLVPLTLQHHNNTTLQSENERLRREAAEFRDLTSENARLTGLLAPAEDAPSDRLADEQLRELLRLRSEVGRLRQQIANAPVASPAPGSLLAGMTANPEMWKVLRDQQKQGMTAMYKEFATLAGLSAEQGENLVNLLADDVMENINLVTAALRDNPDPAQLEWLFARQEAVLLEQVGALLGPEGLAQYQDYTRDLASYLTAAQFKATLSAGDAGEDMARQLRHAMREETERVIEAAGLPPDYQTLPMMNFRNIADPSQADRSLDLLNDIYERTRNRAAAFLSAEELDKFASFATDAVSMNRMALLLNRKLMAPTPQ